MIGQLLIQIVILVAAVLMFMACMGEKNHNNKCLYGSYMICLFCLLLISMKF